MKSNGPKIEPWVHLLLRLVYLRLYHLSLHTAFDLLNNST